MIEPAYTFSRDILSISQIALGSQPVQGIDCPAHSVPLDAQRAMSIRCQQRTQSLVETHAETLDFADRDASSGRSRSDKLSHRALRLAIVMFE